MTTSTNIGKTYKHFKTGKHYRVIAEGELVDDERGNGDYVVLSDMAGVTTLRDKQDFYDMVVNNGEDEPRFRECK